MEDDEDNDDPEISFNSTSLIDPLQHVEIDPSPSPVRRGRKRTYRQSLDKINMENNTPLPGTSTGKFTSRTSGLLESIKKNFSYSDNQSHGKRHKTKDEDDDEALQPFECGICSLKFSTVETLETHVTEKHNESKIDAKDHLASGDRNKTRTREISSAVIDEVTDEFADEVAALEAEEEKLQKKMEVKRVRFEEKKNASKVMMVTMVKKTGKIVVGGKRPSERNWQECPARNWAAEFGYGGVRTDDTPTTKTFQKSPTGISKQISMNSQTGIKDKVETESTGGIASSKATGNGGDLLSKMRSMFRKCDNDADENDEGMEKGEGDKMFRSRGLKGTVKASPGKAPRTLSSSSLRTRQRMEALMERAREFMKQNRKGKIQTKQPKVSKARAEKQSVQDSPRGAKNVSKTNTMSLKENIFSESGDKSISSESVEKTKNLRKSSRAVSQKEPITKHNLSEELHIGLAEQNSTVIGNNSTQSDTDTTTNSSEGLSRNSNKKRYEDEKQTKMTSNIERKTRSQQQNGDASETGKLRLVPEKHLLLPSNQATKQMKHKKIDSEANINKASNTKSSGNERPLAQEGSRQAPTLSMSLLESMQKNFANPMNDDEETSVGNSNPIITTNKNIERSQDRTTVSNQIPNDELGDSVLNENMGSTKSTDDIIHETGEKDKEDEEPTLSINENSGLENDADSDDDDDESDVDMDGLLIPLENGWVCEKRLLGDEERKQRQQELELQRRRRGRSAADDEFFAMR